MLDVDNTLLDFQAAQRQALCGMLAYFGYTCTPEIEKRFDEINKFYWKEFEMDRITLERLVVERFRRFFVSERLTGDAVVAEREYRRNLGLNHDLVPGALDGLDHLRKKYPVYLVTNGRTGTQKMRLTDSGISERVQGIFISEEIGYRKPQKQFFSYVFDHIPPVERDKVVIIGDGYSGDIEGGKKAGIRTIWFNPKGKEGTADFIVKDWKEICEIL